MFERKSQFQKDVEEMMKLVKKDFKKVESESDKVVYKDNRGSLYILRNLDPECSIDVIIDDFGYRAKNLGMSPQQLYKKMNVDGCADFGLIVDEDGITAVNGHIANTVFMCTTFILSMYDTCDCYFDALEELS